MEARSQGGFILLTKDEMEMVAALVLWGWRNVGGDDVGRVQKFENTFIEDRVVLRTWKHSNNPLL
jgi:hypothetical protein